MIPFLDDGDVRLYLGDARETLAELPDESVHMCVTSPPFFGLRDYGTGEWEGGEEGCDHKGPPRMSTNTSIGRSRGKDQRLLLDAPSRTEAAVPYRDTCGKCGARRVDRQIGLEHSPDAWASALVDVFREVRRVLRKDGTLWVEVGDSYANRGLVGAPWMLAFALQADGWYLRSCIVWNKPNAMPESVTDRPTSSHSYVFLFSKASRYLYDAEALREPHSPDGRRVTTRTVGSASHENYQEFGHDEGRERWPNAGRNARSVWMIPTEPNGLAICRVCEAYWEGGAPREHCGQPVISHFAAFPKELVRRCVLAGTSERGVCPECGAPWVRVVEKPDNPLPGSSHTQDLGRQTTGWKPSCSCYGDVDLPEPKHAGGASMVTVSATILDPFAGSGTSLLIARQLGRHALGVELSEPYAKMVRARLAQLSLLA